MFLINTSIIHKTTIAKHYGYSIMLSFVSHAILSIVHNLTRIYMHPKSKNMKKKWQYSFGVW
jgi:hypothetical protein